MSSIHIPPIPSIKMVTEEGYPTVQMSMWNQQLLQSRSAWTVYTPITTHLTAITVNDCAYVQLGKATFVRIGLKGTTDGTTFTVTLPFTAKSSQQTFAVDLAGVSSGRAEIHGADNLTMDVTKFDGTTPANLTVVNWIITGVYEAQ